jgi:hypothetical protein
VSVAGGPDIVENGLVLYLDAANRRSYPGSGTSWVDLSGNNNTGTLTNGPTFDGENGGSILLDGTNDFISTGTTPIQLQGDSTFTISMWVKRLRNEGSNTGIWGFGGNVTNQGICSWWNNNNNEITIDTWARATFTTGQTYPLNEWVYVSWQKIAGAMTRANCIVWKNLDSYTGTQLTILRAENVAPNINNQGITLGRIHPSYNVPVNFQFSSVVVYNRTLTAQEIQQNYNATRSRFNI